MSASQQISGHALAAVSQDTLPSLLDRIASKSAVVGVVGLGYVGLPFAVQSARSGFPTIGFDPNSTKVNSLNTGESYVGDVTSEVLQKTLRDHALEASTDFSRLADCDIVVIAVPTPLTKNLVPDLSFIESATRSIATYLQPGQLITLESTTFPGTTEEIMQPILEGTGLRAEVDFFLAHSPERVDPGNKQFDTKTTTKIVGGVGPRSSEAASLFYRNAVESIVTVSSARAAELVKVYENIFRSVNVALVNELAQLCDRMDLNVWEVLDAAFTKPFGIMPFYPGPGVGGHCIPLDPHYLEYKAREYQFQTRFVTLAGEINRSMPKFVVEKAIRVLGEAGIALPKARILISGVAYKKDIDDARESPSVDVLKLLVQAGAQVFYTDPWVPSLEEGGHTMLSIEPTAENLANFDLVIITTQHSNVDYQALVDASCRVLDTRNATKGVTSNREKIVLL